MVPVALGETKYWLHKKEAVRLLMFVLCFSNGSGDSASITAVC